MRVTNRVPRRFTRLSGRARALRKFARHRRLYAGKYHLDDISAKIVAKASALSEGGNRADPLRLRSVTICRGKRLLNAAAEIMLCAGEFNC